MRSFWVLAALAMSLFAGGCASTPRASADLDTQAKRFEPPPEGLSRLYIYRNELLGMLAGLDLSVDGRPAGTTKGKTYVIADVPAGPHTVVSEGENTSSLNVSTQAGQSVFIWQEVKMGAFRARSQLALVTPEQGRAGVLESQLIESALMRKDSVPGSPPAADSPAAATAPVASTALADPARPTTAIPASPVVIPRSQYAYEAERAAKERGCQGPKGIRPAAQLRAKHGAIEEYDVACTTGVVQVRCDMGMCATVR
jgi:hypothetical protein